jgi:hypothetical protein
VSGIASTLQGERSGDLVPVGARISFHLHKINATSGAQTASSTMGSGVHS